MEIGDDGADEHDIARAGEALGYQTVEFATGHHGEARKWLLEWAPVAPLILCVDRWEHWVCIAGQCGDRLWLFDPERTRLNQNRNGAWPLLPKRILHRWRIGRGEGGDRRLLYFGLLLLPIQTGCPK